MKKNNVPKHSFFPMGSIIKNIINDKSLINMDKYIDKQIKLMEQIRKVKHELEYDSDQDIECIVDRRPQPKTRKRLLK